MGEETLGKDIGFDFSKLDIVFNSNNEFGFVYGNDNLVAAIQHRLNTNIGELKPNNKYGSNLKLIIGGKKNLATLGEASLYVQEALDAEPRIDRVENLDLHWEQSGIRWRLIINITVVPISETVAQNVIVVYEV